MTLFPEFDEQRRRRSRMLLGLFGALFLIALGRLFDLQVIHGAENRLAAEENRFRKEVLRAPRGRVFDRAGRELVYNFANFVVIVNPHHPALRDTAVLRATANRLGDLVHVDGAAVYSKVRAARRTTFLPVRIKPNLSQDEVARIEETSLELPGVTVRVEPLRRYVHGKLAAHALGYLGEMTTAEYQRRQGLGYEADDVVGQAGIEARYDARLHGANGVRYLEVDAFGRTHEFSSPREPEHPIPGDDLYLTIDLDLQTALEAAMDGARRWTSPPRRQTEPDGWPWGAAIALDVRNGEIYAMASRPTFDPNSFAVGIGRGEWLALEDHPGKPLLNRVVQSAHPPGSTFKILTAVAALDAGLATPQTTARVPCAGQLQYGRRTFRCWRPEGHGTLDLGGALEQSCDVYFYQLGDQLGVDGIAKVAARFRLDQPTGIDLGGEKGGLVPDAAYFDDRYGRRGWSRGVALNLAIGQGELLLTPIELATFVAMVANGGQRVTPHLVREFVGPDGHREPTDLAPVRSIVPDLGPHLRTVRGMMRRVVAGERGTGRRAAVDGLAVAGKTGTSQNPHGDDHAVFVSYAPYEDPHLALIVFLEDCGHGGEVAAPVAGEFWAAYAEWRRQRAEAPIG